MKLNKNIAKIINEYWKLTYDIEDTLPSIFIYEYRAVLANISSKDEITENELNYAKTIMHKLDQYID